MGKSDLKRLDLVRHQSGKDGSQGSTDVGTKSQRKHLLHLKNTDSDKRSKGGGSNGRRLDDHGNSTSDSDGKITVDVGGLVDDTRGNSQKHALKNSNQTEEADNQHEKTNEEANTSRDLVVSLGGRSLEESRAPVSLLVAADKSDFAGLLRWVGGVITLDGVEGITGSSLGNILDDILVSEDNPCSKGIDNSLDRPGPLVSITDRVLVHHGSGQVEEVSGGSLNGEEQAHIHVVEHIVHGGSGESTLELVSISHLSESDDGVGHGGSNVRTHDNEDGLPGGDNIRPDKGHNNGSRGRGGLDQRGGKDTNHESGNGVGVFSQKISGGTSSDNLRGRSKNIKSEQEEVEEEADQDNSDKDVPPLDRGVATASLAHLTPGGVADVFDVLFVEVSVSEVGGSRRAHLTGSDLLGLLALKGSGLWFFARLQNKRFGQRGKGTNSTFETGRLKVIKRKSLRKKFQISDMHEKKAHSRRFPAVWAAWRPFSRTILSMNLLAPKSEWMEQISVKGE